MPLLLTGETFSTLDNLLNPSYELGFLDKGSTTLGAPLDDECVLPALEGARSRDGLTAPLGIPFVRDP